MVSSHGEIRDYGDKKYKVIGTRPLRHDGVDKVTGRAIYGADVTMPRMIFGKILRSPHAHAWIKSIDVSKALAHPGVLAVVTAKDFFFTGRHKRGRQFFWGKWCDFMGNFKKISIR